MKQRMSVGQRLAVGFGGLLALMIALLVAVSGWHASSVKAQRTYETRIAPLIEHSADVESELLHAAIDARTYFVLGDPERLELYRQRIQSARAAIRRLEQIPMPDESRQLARDIARRSEPYLRELDRLVEQRRTARVAPSLAEESDLTELRELAVASVRRMSDLQERLAGEALQQMAQARDRMSIGLAVTAILGGAIFILVAFLTTQSVRRPAHALAAVARELAEGNWRPALQLFESIRATEKPNRPSRSEMRMLARAIGSAAVALERREQHLRADAQIAQATSSTLDRERLASLALPPIVECVRAQVGVIYWLPAGSNALKPVARHALTAELADVPMGEGVPGQAAQERRPVIVRDIPPDSPFSIRLGYDQAAPRTVAAVPVLFRHTLHGVLLVASLSDLDADAEGFLNAAARQLGIGMQNVAAFEEVQRLVRDLRERNEQVQAQNEELQAQKEEIQSQSEELQAQAEELQAQSEEIRRQNEELRRRGEELQKQTQLLIEADEHKNHFLGVLAHELRNPMAPISNSLVILKRAPPGTETALRAQAVIERQTRHLIRLIDDLLDVTHISQGKIRLVRERIDLREVARGVVEDQRGALDEAGLTLETSLGDSPVWVRGDQTRLSQVLGNLISNSIKFTDRGGKVRVVLEARDQAQLVVADTGIGIAPEVVPQLFRPFSQVHGGPMTRSNDGLGLGLALVKALVELHGGTVHVHSEGPNKGTQFNILLPLDNTA